MTYQDCCGKNRLVFFADNIYNRIAFKQIDFDLSMMFFVMKNEKKRLMNDLWCFSALGMSVAIAIFMGLGIGYYLDNYMFDTSPWLTLIFLGFGIAAGYRNIYLAMKKSRNL